MSSHMMDRPLLISSLLAHAVQNHPQAQIITRRVEGDFHQYTWGDAARRAAQVANALTRLGVQRGERIGTLAWNTYRHLELYFGVSGMGAVLHTVNPRLFPEQVSWIVNHAADRFLFVDLTFLPLVESIAAQLQSVEKIVVMTDRASMPKVNLPNAICYEELITAESADYLWPEFDEQTPAALCYTSGTTGNPKGVMFTHRSTVLHAFGGAARDALNIGCDTVILPVVPMFHVNAWGMPYAAAMTGAKLVFPGPALDGKSLHELIEREKVTLALGVPTVWLGLLNYLDSINARLTTVKNVVVGGSAAPLSMIRAFDQKHGAFLVHAWGMTEMSPLGTVNAATAELMALPAEERYARQAKQGRPVFGVEMKIVDDAGTELPRNGKTFGRLLVRGPWIVGKYYLNEDRSSFENGWFDTGDVATIDERNTMQIVDRKKDVIKSGGEWISSIDLENVAVGHPAVKEACVIGVAHPKWDERPLLLCILKDNHTCTREEMLEFLGGQVAKFWLPDDVLFVKELPHTATGKLLKIELRKQYAGHLMK
ncbi:MAG: 3-(methylthio)propionyl-CoA ligase [Pseudomonadota bacterium]